MATVDRHMDHSRRDSRSGPGGGRRRGRGSPAEVIMIRPARTSLFGSLVTMARVLASPRAQATSVRSTPRRPSSPAPLTLFRPLAPAPDDAA